MNQEIQIVDVILTKNYFGEYKGYSVVVDRMPKYVYARGEKKTFGYNRSEQPLTAHDSGFYDFMEDRPGTTDAFAGRKFTISMDDGSTLECNGQVWASFNPACGEPIVQVGVATLEKLSECYVFFGGHISKAKLQAWLDENKPSRNYRKYDARNTVAWLDERLAENHYGDRPVSAARARKLKKRGVTIRKRGEVRTWSHWYERQKANIQADIALDEVAK